MVDTTELSAGFFTKKIQEKVGSSGSLASLRVEVGSFGFKYGLPPTSDLVFDVRFLPNPYYQLSLRAKTGLDEEVSDYIFKREVACDFLDKSADYLSWLIPYFEGEGKEVLRVSVGCSGGQHRSVAMSEALRRRLKSYGLGSSFPNCVHRDLSRL